MERNDKTRVTVSLFETLVRRLIDASFRFPGGESGRRTVAACLELLRTRSGGELSDERIADFCICQVHAISRFDESYLSMDAVALLRTQSPGAFCRHHTGTPLPRGPMASAGRAQPRRLVVAAQRPAGTSPVAVPRSGIRRGNQTAGGEHACGLLRLRYFDLAVESVFGRLPDMLPRRALPQAYRRPLSGTLPLAPRRS